MKFRVERREGYVLAELENRDTRAQMREFLEAVKAACLAHQCPSILIRVQASRAMFKAEDWGLGEGFAAALATPACRVALVSDSSELNHAHEYIALIARQQSFNVRAFRDAEAAQRWLASNEEIAAAPELDGLQPARPPKLS